jgi:hypothetical protein
MGTCSGEGQMISILHQLDLISSFKTMAVGRRTIIYTLTSHDQGASRRRDLVLPTYNFPTNAHFLFSFLLRRPDGQIDRPITEALRGGSTQASFADCDCRCDLRVEVSRDSIGNLSGRRL